jgi:hypothetical protein
LTIDDWRFDPFVDRQTKIVNCFTNSILSLPVFPLRAPEFENKGGTAEISENIHAGDRSANTDCVRAPETWVSAWL